MATANTVTINGKDYSLDTLPDAAKAQLNNLRIADREIARLRNQLALAETARRVFARGVAGSVSNEPTTAEATTADA